MEEEEEEEEEVVTEVMEEIPAAAAVVVAVVVEVLVEEREESMDWAYAEEGEIQREVELRVATLQTTTLEIVLQHLLPMTLPPNPSKTPELLLPPTAVTSLDHAGLLLPTTTGRWNPTCEIGPSF